MFLCGQEVGEVVELLQGGSDLRLVVGSHSAQLLGQGAGVDQEPVHGVLAGPELLEDEVGILHQADDVVTAVVEDLAHGRGSTQQGLQLLVAAGDGLREGRDPLEGRFDLRAGGRSEEHTSELQSLMRISYAVFCLKKKKK